MLVLRQMVTNLIEPAVLSMRVPKGVGVELDMEFVRADLTPLPYDPLATLLLTSRSGDRTAVYQVISTDITNGKGTATIPEDALNDDNGYQVRLFGMIDGREMLLGMGAIRLIDGPS